MKKKVEDGRETFGANNSKNNSKLLSIAPFSSKEQLSVEDMLAEETITDGGIVYLRNNKLESNEIRASVDVKEQMINKKDDTNQLTLLKELNVDRVKSSI